MPRSPFKNISSNAMMQTDISDVLNNLKSLSDSADLIIHQHTHDDNHLDKWFSAIKETAVAIINNGVYPEVNGCPVIPNILSEIKGEKLQAKRRRVSSFLAAAQKDHARLSHRKSRASLRKIVLEKNNNQWEISHTKSNKDQRSVKNSGGKSISPNVKDKVSKSSTNISPLATIEKVERNVKKKTEDSCSTPQPLQNEILVPNSDEKTPVTRSQTRALSNEHPVGTLKKLRKYDTQELTPDIIRKKSINKNLSSVNPTVKHGGQSSVASDQTPQNETIILNSSDSEESLEIKPNTCLKRKSSIQLTQNKAKKNKNKSSEFQAIKNTKLHENNASGSKNSKAVMLNKKAVIQPKNSSTSQQINVGSEKRILREIQKKEVANQNTKKLKTMRQMKIEESKKMREIKMEKVMQQRLKLENEKKERMKCRTVSKQENVQQKELSVKKTVPRKVQTEEKTEIIKKTTLKLIEDDKAASNSPNKAPPKPVRTQVKNVNLSPDKQTEIKIMDQTFTNPSVETLSSSKKEFTKPSPLNSTFVAKTVNIISTPTTKKPISKLSKTPVSNLNKKNNNYTMTPCESSFVSYDVSEIKSDDDSDEEESSNNKPIPSWATGVRLRNALLNQQYNPLDTAELFGNYFETPDLGTIMGVEKKQYFKRTSSAIWINSPNRSLLY